MSGVYPQLEDMNSNRTIARFFQGAHAHGTSHAIANPDAQPPSAYGAVNPVAPGALAILHPFVKEYIGLASNENSTRFNMPIAAANQMNMQVPCKFTTNEQYQLGPISSDGVGITESEVRQGVRQIILCKNQDGKMGLRVRSVDKGIFVTFVFDNMPAALAGLRFGDQILRMNGKEVAEWDTNRAMKFLKNCPKYTTVLIIRDRPFARCVTLQKDSAGDVGFVSEGNKIVALVKNSSAARNGLLINHTLVEVNGQNVIGLNDEETKKIFDKNPAEVSVTIMPTSMYEHIIKRKSSWTIQFQLCRLTRTSPNTE